MKILVTGFVPFDGDTSNPSMDAVSALPIVIDGAFIVRMQLPVAFGTSVNEAVAAIAQHAPDAVLSVGLAGGRCAITPEFVAINHMHAARPDNAGFAPQHVSIVQGGPAAYFSTLPVFDMVKEMLAGGVPAEVSYTAGTFVCNQLMYGVLHHLHMSKKNALAGFVHVPYTPAMAAARPTPASSLALEDTVKGLTCCIRAILRELHAQA